MKRIILLMAVMAMTSLVVAMPVKMTEKSLKNGVTTHEYIFNTGNVNYRLNFQTSVKDDREYIKGIGLMGGVRKNKFSKRGWWFSPNGFIQLKVGANNIFAMPVTYRTDNGVATFTFGSGSKAVKLIFRAQDNDDKLLFGIDFATPPADGVLTLICYPSDLMKKMPEQRNRYAHTVKRAIKTSDIAGELILDKDEYWVYYEDKSFDTSKSDFFSTCALLFNPKEVNQVAILRGNYGVKTKIVLSPKNNNYNFILWEFPGRKNEKCLESMKNLQVNFK